MKPLVALNLTVGAFYDVTSIHRAAERVRLLVVSYAEGCVEREAPIPFVPLAQT